jgi:hypothetical protein
MILLFAETASLSIGLLFWILFIVATVLGGIGFYNNRSDYWGFGNSLLTWILILLLGIGTFGFPIRFQ